MRGPISAGAFCPVDVLSCSAIRDKAYWECTLVATRDCIEGAQKKTSVLPSLVPSPLNRLRHVEPSTGAGSGALSTAVAPMPGHCSNSQMVFHLMGRGLAPGLIVAEGVGYS